MLNITHGGDKVLLDGEPVEACKIHVLAGRDSQYVLYPMGQRAPLVDEILHTVPRGQQVPAEYHHLQLGSVCELLLWLPKYGRIARFAESEALTILNSNLAAYTYDTVGLRAKQNSMTKLFVVDYNDLPQPFEVTQGLQRPDERELYRHAMNAWQREQDHDYGPLEKALRTFVESKGKRLPPVGQIRVPA